MIVMAKKHFLRRCLLRKLVTHGIVTFGLFITPCVTNSLFDLGDVHIQVTNVYETTVEAIAQIPQDFCTVKTAEAEASDLDSDELQEEQMTQDDANTSSTATVEDDSEKVTRFVANCSAYTASPDECGGNATGITASGRKAVEGRTIAMDDVPLGTKVKINGKVYTVDDRFGGGYSHRIDIYFDNKKDAENFGRQYLEVEIVDENV